MNPKKYTINITTSTGGAATSFTTGGAMLQGMVKAVKYTKATGSPLASTADITITTEDTGITIATFTNINATTTIFPVAVSTLNTGAASTITESEVPVVYERVQAVVAQGGNTKVGTIEIIVA